MDVFYTFQAEAPMTALLVAMAFLRLFAWAVMLLLDQVRTASKSPQLARYTTLKREAALMRAKLQHISAQDEFARYFKLDRQMNAKNAEADKLSIYLAYLPDSQYY
eukprot:m.13633 g.13633  ORF g.13633 m.13633 type:complete len:106 (+) comp10193_c0_seq1:120-437(+)